MSNFVVMHNVHVPKPCAFKHVAQFYYVFAVSLQSLIHYPGAGNIVDK